MRKGHEIARGKTKILFEHEGQPDVLVVKQMDGITAGDGARRDEIPGKGRIAAQTTARVFRLLNLCGLPTHYLNGGEDDDDNEMLVRRAQMIPLEVVVRGVAIPCATIASGAISGSCCASSLKKNSIIRGTSSEPRPMPGLRRTSEPAATPRTTTSSGIICARRTSISLSSSSSPPLR